MSWLSTRLSSKKGANLHVLMDEGDGECFLKQSMAELITLRAYYQSQIPLDDEVYGDVFFSQV
jgi:hypothetical protein